MYLHLGQNTVLANDEVIGIFDLETTTISKITRDFLTGCEKRHEVINVTEELPKSFVLCACGRDREQRVYISQISTGTLEKRAGYLDRLSDKENDDDVVSY